MKKRFRSLISVIIALAMLLPTVLPMATIAAEENTATLASEPTQPKGNYGFVDFPTGWSAPAMAHAVENGLLYGKSEDRIHPADNLTRAEMATIINRAFGSTIEKDISEFSDVSDSAWYYKEIKKAYNMQTLYGDAGGTMRPDAFIIREEAIAIVARAMVLSGYSASNLDRFKDKDEIADWAIDPLASMVANGYVNGDENSNMNPKAFITREEFAQLLHNIVKHYYDAKDGVTTFEGNLMINEPFTEIKDLVINGDLILGDGVGTSTIVLTNVKVTGRILIRGAAHISFEGKTHTDAGVTVKNVNGVVHFDHFSDEVIFNDMLDHTPVTFKKGTSSGSKPSGGGGGGLPPAPTTATYVVQHYQEALDGTFALFETETLSNTIGASVTATAKTYTGFSEDTSNPSRVSTGTVTSDGTLILKLYYVRDTHTVTFDFAGATLDPATPTSITDKYGATVVLPTTGFSNGALNFGGWFTGANGTGTQVTQVVIGTSDTTVYAYWTTQSTYKVEHYQENIDSTYSIVSADTQILTEDAGNSVTATPKTYAGFHENTSHPSRIPSGSVLADNSLVLKLYYERNEYTLTYDFGGATTALPTTVQVKYGHTVVLPTTGFTNGTKPFEGWKDAGGNPVTEITMGLAPVTVYAQWGTALPTTAGYVVEHYQEAIDGTYSVFETENLTGTIGATVTAVAKTYTGFYENTSYTSRVPSGAVLADNSLVLKLYYTRNTYTFTFDVQGGAISGTPKTVYKFGETLDLPVPTKGTDTFGGWFTGANGTGTEITNASVLGTDVTGDTTVYAHWIGGVTPPPTPADFTVKHFTQNLNAPGYIQYGADQAETIASGTAVKPEDYDITITGFTFDATQNDEVVVLADGSTVLNIYYTRNVYTLEYHLDGGVLTPPYETSFIYGEARSLPVATKSGQMFIAWVLHPGDYTMILDTSDISDSVLATLTGNTVDLYAWWTDAPTPTTTTFTVKHLFEKLDGIYETKSERADQLNVPGDTEVSIIPANYSNPLAGFEYYDYSFDGTDNSGKPKADGSTVLTIRYNRLSYDVIYNFNDTTPATVHTVTLKYGEIIDTLYVPTVTVPNKYFAGWYKDAACTESASGLETPVGGTTIYAKWTDNPTYLVRHHKEKLSGGYDVEPEYIEAAYNATVTAVAKTDADAGFEGFNYSHGDAGLTGTNDGHLEFDLYYNRKTYTVSFDVDGGTVVAPKEYKYGEAFALPATTKQGYEVEGWYTAPNGAGTMISAGDLAGTAFTAGTLYVKWAPVPVDFTVEHYKQEINGTYPAIPALSSTEQEYTEAVVDASAYKTDFTGFTFDAANSPSVTVLADGTAVLKIKYTRNSYDVVYDYGEAGGSHTVTLKYEEGVDLTYVPTVTVPNKYFAGWFAAPTGGTELTTLTTPLNGITIYAQWTENPTYTVIHYREDLNGAYPDSDAVVEHFQAGLNATVTAVYKTDADAEFVGFNANFAHASRVESGINDGGLVLKLFYDRKTYTVSFDVDGGTVVAPKEYKYGEPFALPATTKQGYEVEGWYTAPNGAGTMISAGDLAGTAFTAGTLYVKWAPVPVDFTVEHYKQEINGTYPAIPALSSTEQEYTETVVDASAYKTDFTGFTFDAANSPSVTVLADGTAVLKIKYTRNSYDVVYDYGEAGGSHTVTLKYEEGVDLTYVPTVTVPNKYFAGWYEDAALTTPAQNVKVPVGGTTIYAKWEDNPSYTVMHYREALDGTYPESDAVVEYIKADLNATVNAVYRTALDAEFVGFNANTTHPSRVESGINDGTLTLKLYYDRERYDVSFNTGLGTSVADKEYKYDEPFVYPDTTRQYYKVEGWYTGVNGTGTQIFAGNLAGTDFFAGTLYAKWVLDWNEKVVFTANVVEEDADNDMFSILVDISNNPVGISSYELTLGFDNNNVVAVLDGGKVVTDLGGLGGAAITSNADTIDNDIDAAALNSITVSWDNGTENKSGNANLFKIRFKIIGTKEDEDLELTSGGYSMFRMRRAVSLIPGLESLPFTLEATKVEISQDDGSKFEPEKETFDDGLEPYAIEHYKENAEDDDFTKVYTQYGHAVLGDTVTAQYRDVYLTQQGFTKDENNPNKVEKAEQLAEGGAILKLYYLRQRYTVNFDYQGATTEGISSVDLKVGAKVYPNLPAENTFEKTDWNFAGWFTEEGGQGTKVDDSYKVPVGGVTLYAHWTQTPYKVEHYQEELDGSFTLKETDDLQAKAGTLATATAKNYLGFNAPGTMPSATVEEDGSTVIKVNYTRKTYTINYDFDGGWEVNGPAKNTFKYGETITLPEGTNGDDQIIGGWFTDVEGNGTQVTDTANIDSILSTLSGDTITLYAYWVDEIGEYSIEFYQQNVDGLTYPSTPTEVKTGLTGAVGTYVEVDKNSAEIKDKYFGFSINSAVSTLKKKLTKEGTVLRVYYDRKTYTVEYDFDGGEADGTYKTTFKYGQEFTLAKAVNSDGTTLEGWYTQAEGNGTKFGNGGANVTFTDATLETFTNDKVKLYANWVEQLGEYTVEFYQEDLEGTGYTKVLADTITGLTGTVGKEVKVDATADEIKNKYVGFSVNTTESELSKILAEDGSTVLKVYYDRNTYTLHYNYSGADTEGIASATFKYGQNITFPDESTFEKESFKFAGWYTTEDFNDDEIVYTSNTIEQIIDLANGETETTIYAKWARNFIVTFREATKVGEYVVDPAVENTVPYSAFPYDQLTERYKTGYFENASVSDVYAGNEYTHTFEGNWYYTNAEGEDEIFTDKTIVDRDLTVRYKFRYVRLELFVEKLGQNVVFEVPFEESTRFIDTLKDELFVNQQKILIGADELDVKSKFMALNLKLVNFLDSKGIEIVEPGTIFAEDGEILKQHIKFNAFSYLNEESVKNVVVKAIKTTFKNDPLRMRGVIDEMMQEKDPDVIELMDTMLVSMLSGSDSVRIKGIIADAVESAIAYSDSDTPAQREEKDKLRDQIKDIIVGRLDEEALPEFTGEKVVTNSVKDAVYNYFMDKDNDANIRNTVIDLINDAYEIDANGNYANPEVRTFVKDYITDYFKSDAGSDVFDALILELGETLDANNPDDQPVIDLIHDVLADDDRNSAGLTYLEELVDGVIENLDQKVGTELYDFVVDSITTELTKDAGELETLIRAIGNSEPADLKAVLATAMENDSVFEIVVETAVSNDNVFADVINSAVSNTDVFETLVRQLCATDADFYSILVDIALSSTTLTNEVKNAVVDNDDALISVLKEVSTNSVLRAEVVEEILVAADAELKGKLTSPIDSSSEYYDDVKAQALSQAENKVIDIVENGINEIDHPQYWSYAFEKAMEVAEAKVTQDLIDLSVDPNGSLWAGMFADAMAQAEIDVTAELNGGIDYTSDYYTAAINGAKEKAEEEITTLLATGIAEGSEYWDVAYETAKSILREEIDTNFESKIDEIKTDANLNAQVKAWAQNSIGNSDIENAIKDLALDLAASTDADDIVLKNSIIDTVIETVKGAGFDTAGLASSITTELNKAENANVKEKVVAKAIAILNDDAYALIKTGLIADVLDEVLPDSGAAEAGKEDIVEELIDQLVIQVNSDPTLKATVISVAIDAVVYDDHVNEEAIKIINKLIDESPESNPDGTPTFKEETITYIITYVLETPDVRDQVMNKVVTMIETPYDPNDPNAKDYKAEAIDFAFDYLGTHAGKRNEIAGKLLDSILNEVPVNGVYEQRENLANDVKDIMFNSGKDIRDRILDIGFEQMFAGDIEELVSLALDQLINDDTVRRDMIIAVIETEDGREGILDILFDELERDPTFIDDMVDIAMKGKYGDLVDTFVSDLINNGKIQINPDNRQIAEEIVLPMLDDITLDTVLNKLPAKVKDVLPTSVIEKVFNKFKTKAREKLVEGIEEAKNGNSKDISVMVDNELDIMNEVIVPLYNKIFPKVVDKAEDFYYYNENVYLKAIVDMIDPAVLFDNTKPASTGGTGYRLRSAEEYYEIIRNISVLADDAADWYMENISDDQINGAIDKVAGKVNTLLTKVNGFVGNRIPMSKIDKVVNIVKKVLDKRERAYNVTTTGIFDKADKVYNKLIDIVIDKTGVDITKPTTIEVTFDGSKLAVNDKDVNIEDREISVTVKGYTFKLDSESITALNKTVNIDRFVQKVADLFGTRSVTIQIINDAPYSYGVHVGNNYIRLAAEYK